MALCQRHCHPEGVSDTHASCIIMHAGWCKCQVVLQPRHDCPFSLCGPVVMVGVDKGYSWLEGCALRLAATAPHGTFAATCATPVALTSCGWPGQLPFTTYGVLPLVVVYMPRVQCPHTFLLMLRCCSFRMKSDGYVSKPQIVCSLGRS